MIKQNKRIGHGRNVHRGALKASAAFLYLLATAAHADPVKVEAFGDSLFAGYGLQAAEAFPALLQADLKQKGIDAQVTGAGVSGDTTADGLARLDWMLSDKPDFVVVEFGGNDVLRGLDPARARDNMDHICATLAQHHIRFMLAGMMAPASLGPAYQSQFDSIYPDLAKKYGVPLYPFVLNGLIFHPDLMQKDGIHPNQAGEKIMAADVAGVVADALKSAP